MAQRDDIEWAIKLDNVSKTFRLPHEKQTSLKGLFLNSFKTKKYEKQRAVNDVSFEVKKGEFFGIVGRNGSGKSTLLKMIAGVYQPNKGKIKVNGSLVPFIELGVGFNPELTGRENVYLNGALLGFNRKEMFKMYDEIVQFAELENFMDQKLKNYSSGMQVRLAFSIAIRAEGEILLLDEVLAVGDSAFQQKCYDYFATLKRNKRTIILVTHNMQAVERFCDRAMLIDGGKIEFIGNNLWVAEKYESKFLREDMERIKLKKVIGTRDPFRLDKNEIKILETSIIQDKLTKSEINNNENFIIRILLEGVSKINMLDVGINIKNRDKIMLVEASSIKVLKKLNIDIKEKIIIEFDIQNIFKNGVYFVNIGIAENSNNIQNMLVRYENAAEFMIFGSESRAIISPNISIRKITV